MALNIITTALRGFSKYMCFYSIFLVLFTSHFIKAANWAHLKGLPHLSFRHDQNECLKPMFYKDIKLF